MWHFVTYIAPGALNTILLTATSFILGAVVALPVSIARRSSLVIVRRSAQGLVEVIRSVPVLAWLFIVFFGLPQYGLRPSPFVAAVTTLSIVSAAYLSEIYRGGLAAIDRGQLEASHALGLNSFDTGARIVAPQVFRVVLPPMATYAIGLLKDSALASTIGVVELTFLANAEAQQTGQGLTAYLVAGVIYLLIGIPLAVASRHVDSRLRAKLSLT